MNSYLNQILASVRARVSAAKSIVPQITLQDAMSKRADKPRGFTAALKREVGRTQIIGEIKRASPSRGPINTDLDPVMLSTEYALGGATAISVLTEPNYFRGTMDDLKAVRGAVQLPVLRKDFVIDPYQVAESYVAGADAILVIIRAVESDNTLRAIFHAAEEFGLDVLTECYDEADCHRACVLAADCANALELVGINCRDLESFQTDLRRPASLAEIFPPETTIVSLSGVKTRSDIQKVQAASSRISRFLIGESLARSAYPAAMLNTMLGGALAHGFSQP